MTFEAVDLDSGIGMATLAEILVAAEHAVVHLAGVAIDAVGKAVFAAANTFAHCLVALVHDQLHVITAHELWVFHALPALADVELGRK